MISPLRPGALVLCILVVFLAAPLSAQTFDPQSLVGEWAGDWATRAERQFTGQISMSISRVAGGKVYIESAWSGARTVPPTKLVGNVTADGFTIPGPQFLTTYTLTGDRLTGITGPGGTTSVSMPRKK
jgi:hypothetical protein